MHCSLVLSETETKMATTISRSNIKIAPMAIVCKECDLIGDISIGARTIIHPKAKIVAEAGPIIIGESNLIEEGVQIINRLPEDGSPTDETPVMVIGNHNVFEVASYVESLKIGNFNVVEVKASVGRNTELSSGCIVGAKCCLSTDECLQENTVIYGRECRRRVQQEHPFQICRGQHTDDICQESGSNIESKDTVLGIQLPKYFWI